MGSFRPGRIVQVEFRDGISGKELRSRRDTSFMISTRVKRLLP